MRIPNFCHLRKSFFEAFFHKNREKQFQIICFVIAVVCAFLYQIIEIKKLYISDSILYIPQKEDKEEGSVQLLPNTKNSKNSHILSHIVASKSGTKYYFTWCVSSRIKEENKIYFTTEEEAQERGLTLSKLCF
jgi:hypothetical protein